MGETSWQVKARYNAKAYSRVTVELNKELVTRWSEKLQAEGISRAEFVRRAMKEYLGESTKEAGE